MGFRFLSFLPGSGCQESNSARESDRIQVFRVPAGMKNSLPDSIRSEFYGRNHGRIFPILDELFSSDTDILLFIGLIIAVLPGMSVIKRKAAGIAV